MRAARRFAVVAGLAACALAGPALALDPAGGAAEPPASAAAGEREPDASVEEAPAAPAAAADDGQRSRLARGSQGPLAAPPRESSGTSTGLTIGAVLIVLGLGAGAVAMRVKRQKLAPLSPSESRLTVLSSSRVGPKAFAVTAHVGGRVLLLGVTDHSVTNLGWLDAPEPAAPERERAEAEREPEAEGDELPDDYPGSALRASSSPAQFATSNELKRFQDVLSGVAPRLTLPLRPAYAGDATGSGADAATTLAAQTSDVVAAGAAPAAGAKALSLRRKRRSRESFPPREPREPRAAAPNRAPKAPSPSLEGQVAGLRSLRSNS